MTRCFVTGIAGFFGSALADALVRRGVQVSGIDNLSTGSLANLTSCLASIDFHEGDIRDAALLEKLLVGVDTIFHLAAVTSVERCLDDPLASYAVNVKGTQLLLAAATKAGVRRIVFASSAAIYGDTPWGTSSEYDRPAPASSYAAWKLQAELLLEEAALTGEIETISLRFANIFGPRQSAGSSYSGSISLLIEKLLKPERAFVALPQDCSRPVDLLYVDDAVRAAICAMEAPQELTAGTVYNVGSGHPQTLREAAYCLSALVGFTGAFFAGFEAQPEVVLTIGNLSTSTRELGFSPAVSLRDGLAQTVAWKLISAESGRLAIPELQRVFQNFTVALQLARPASNDFRAAA